jgi:Fe2+ transport system protein FeoA
VQLQTLDAVPRGGRARIDEIIECDAAPLLAGLGLLPGTLVSRIGEAPLADPLLFLARGARLAIRRSHAKCVRVQSIES